MTTPTERPSRFFIDDERFPTNETLVICRSYKDFIWYAGLLTGIDYISFDHDLGEGGSGYDCALFIVEHGIELKEYDIHSMNPVGRSNIKQLLDKHIERQNENKQQTEIEELREEIKKLKEVLRKQIEDSPFIVRVDESGVIPYDGEKCGKLSAGL